MIPTIPSQQVSHVSPLAMHVAIVSAPLAGVETLWLPADSREATAHEVHEGDAARSAYYCGVAEGTGHAAGAKYSCVADGAADDSGRPVWPGEGGGAGRGGGDGKKGRSMTVTVNARYHEGLKIFKQRCSDYQATRSVADEMLQSDVLGIRTNARERKIMRICDVGCGDGTITAHILSSAMGLFSGSIVLDLVEPEERCLLATTKRVRPLGGSRTQIRAFCQSAENYFGQPASVEPYDIITSSHSLYFFPLSTLDVMHASLAEYGYLWIVAMSRQSIMAELKGLFHGGQTTTADEALRYLEDHHVAESPSIAVSTFSSVLNLEGIDFAVEKRLLNDEAKNLLSLMIQKNVDDLSEDEYVGVRQRILGRMSGGRLILENKAILVQRKGRGSGL